MNQPNHPYAASQFNRDEARVDWHDGALWFVRQKRDKAVAQVPEWELLRAWASQIKDHALANLDGYLEVFEKKAQENGIHVHWATDADEHNRLVLEILQKKGLQKMLKSKSMLTEECHLNPFLEKNGIEVVDTDLGERIVQWRGEPPSHIVLPAIHLKKEDVGKTFHEKLGTDSGASDPQYLTEAARQHLRSQFLEGCAALTGVNFAVAETGSLVVCTNEGNADMGVHLSPVHIASMGIEKVIPKTEHLGVFLRLLARSATGQPITTYTSHFQQPGPGQEMHVIIVDNGRTRQLGRPEYRASLKCIRCGACLNTCPVYRRSGGHSYHNAVSGPIGIILAPNLDIRANADLPFASTLCGSCTAVCPVKINIHEQIWQWRQEVAAQGHVSKQGIGWLAGVLSNPLRFRLAGAAFRNTMRFAPFLVKNKFNPWFKGREMPDAPKQSFREWYLKNRKKA